MGQKGGFRTFPQWVEEAVLYGKRAYGRRLGKDPSLRHSRHSIANEKYLSPPKGPSRLARP